MRRALAIVGLLLLLATCAGGSWFASHPRVALFVVDGARDVRVEARRGGEWQISYRVAEIQPAWYESLGRELERQGWSAINLDRYDGLKAAYMRDTPLPIGRLREWVYMTINEYSDPHAAQIRVRRWIELPWGRLSRF